MKRIFSFLLTIGLLFGVSKVWGQNVTMPAGSKVRYGIELKKFTKQEAQDAVTRGYVDLWVYAWFNQKFVDVEFKFNVEGINVTKKLIVLDASTEKIESMDFGFVANTQGYQIVYKDGTDDLRPDNTPDNCVATFASSAMQGLIDYTSFEKAAKGNITFRNCTGSCSGGSLSGPAGGIEEQIADAVTKIETFEGETWYGRALYKVRFRYFKPESFYVEHRFNNQPANDCGLATSNFNISLGDGNIYAPYPEGCLGNADWSQTHADNPAGVPCERIPGAFGTIRGGVEVIAGMEAEAPVEATCWGTDAPGKFTVTSWGGNSWGNYSTVTVTAKSATSSKKLTVGTDLVFGGAAICGASGAVTATGSPEPAEYPFTLKPSGYTLPDGSLADSLIWAIEGTFLA